MSALNKEEMEFIQQARTGLPPVIARASVARYLGDMVAAQTLANADATGHGPERSWRVGQKIVYNTDSLLEWIVKKYGITRMRGINQSL